MFGIVNYHLPKGSGFGKVVILSTGTLTSARTESAISAFPLRLLSKYLRSGISYTTQFTFIHQLAAKPMERYVYKILIVLFSIVNLLLLTFIVADNDSANIISLAYLH